MEFLTRLRTFAALVLLTVCSPAQGTSGAEPAESVAKQIGTYLEAHHKLGRFSGTALVADDGKIIYQGSFGLANSDWEIPNAIDTKFRVASITKQFTSMATLLLVKDGKLELDAPLTKYLPDYPKESGDKVTIHHLLNHTSGIPSYTDMGKYWEAGWVKGFPVDEFVVKFCSEPLDFEPGTDFRYNNSGYFLLGAVIESVTGKTYASVLRERIFDPLGMNESGLDDQYEVLTKRATGYADLLGGRRLAQWIDMRTPYAAGSIYSTVGDLWKWDQALRSRTLLDGELEQKMFTKGRQDYGYGWEIGTDESGAALYSHSGGMPGVSTMIGRVPSRGRCVIFLRNTSPTAGGALHGILGILDGIEPEAPAMRADREIAKLVLDKGVEAGMEKFASLHENLRLHWIERDVNMIAYQLIGQGRFDEAVGVFEFLVTAYPDSSNAWDSLGEGQALAGKRELAIASYRKALELDPESETAPAMLKRLEVK